MKNIYHLKFLIIGILIFFSRNTFAQCPENCVTDTIHINTGYNYATNQLYNYGSQDSLWTVIMIYSGSGTPSAPASVPYSAITIAPPQVWDQFPNNVNRYISAYSTSTNNGINWIGFACPSSPGYASGSPYVFKRSFNICSSASQLINIHLEVMADDLLDTVKIDSIPIGIYNGLYICNVGAPFAYATRMIIDTSLTLTPGNHDIKASIVNMSATDMGLSVVGKIYSNNQNYVIKTNNCDLATRVQNINSSFDNLSLYPNPVKEELTIEATFGISNAYVYSTDGRVMREIKFGNVNKANISLSSLPEGVYFLRINNNISRTFYKRD